MQVQQSTFRRIMTYAPMHSRCKIRPPSAATKGKKRMARTADRRRFGQITKMRSGRWQARYTVPLTHESGRGGHIVTAPPPFEPGTYGREAAGDWLRSAERRPQNGKRPWSGR